jgi:DNA sulfur modification protein DndB
MATKTLIPALKAHVGDWPYYICSMKYGSVAREINFAFELNDGNQELGTLIQRGLGDRTKEIVKYLLSHESRFLGALIVAAWGGDPIYHPVEMQDPEGLLTNLDSDFGVLEFNGSHQYFALDGQHRLKAIKDSLKQDPSIGSEDICVLIVSHFDDEEGRRRTRRLFTNINKHAKKTTKAEDIALDEDDASAIITRRLLMEHPFLKADSRVRVIGKSADDGSLKLATGGVNKTDSSALFTMGSLYEIVKSIILGFKLSAHGADPSRRPSSDVLESTYDSVATIIDELLVCCGTVKEQLESAASARDVRAPKDDESGGHAFMRVMIQRCVAEAVAYVLVQEELSWDQVKKRLSALKWELREAPWESVVSIDGLKLKMLTNRDYTALLTRLIVAHIGPPSKAAIKSARSDYRKLRGRNYPVSEEALFSNLCQSDS